MNSTLTTIGSYKAKNRLSELLDRVSKGAEIVITRHDRPVARLIPVDIDLTAQRMNATEELKKLRERYSLKGLSVRKLIDDGRK